MGTRGDAHFGKTIHDVLDVKTFFFLFKRLLDFCLVAVHGIES